jgi:acyl-coenzyme A thioesterase PaaI-like protein
MRTRLNRLAFNFFPAFRGSGGRITHLAEDWSEVRLEVPLTWRTRNYVGTIYGGSMYAAVDPIYMLMLLKRLGPGYVVWLKGATIRFRKPGRKTLRATFTLDDEELAAVVAAAADVPSVDRVYRIELVDPDGVVCAEVEETLYVARKGNET